MPDKTITQVGLVDLKEMAQEFQRTMKILGMDPTIAAMKAKWGEDRFGLFLHLIKCMEEGTINLRLFVRARLVEQSDGKKIVDISSWRHGIASNN